MATASMQVFDLSSEGGEQAFQEAVSRLNLLTSDAFGHIELPLGDDVLEEGIVDLFNRLAPGEANGPLFPDGSPVEFGLTIQTNFDGGSPEAPNPGLPLFAYNPLETGGLHFAAAGNNDSLDMIVDPPGFPGGVQAFVFDLYYFPWEPEPGTAEIRLYSSDDELLGFAEIELFSTFPVGQTIGIVASEDLSLHRINLWTGGESWADVSNFGIYVIPEPATVGICAGILSVILATCRHRKRCK